MLWMDDQPLVVGKEYVVKLGTKEIVGVLTDDPRRGGHFPVIAFPDGRWGRADDLIVLVDEAVA